MLLRNSNKNNVLYTLYHYSHDVVATCSNGIAVGIAIHHYNFIELK